MSAALLVTTVLIVITSILLFGIAWSALKARRLASLSWVDLLGKLQPVASDKIEILALRHLHPASENTGHSPHELWDTLGGAEGLERMSDNASVLIALASYAQRWDPPAESIFAAAQLRRDGVILRKALRRVGMGALSSDNLKFSLYLHEAASAYYLMTKRLMFIAKCNPMSISEALEQSMYSTGSFG